MTKARRAATTSLSEVHQTVPVPSIAGANPLRKLFAFAGPAYLISVGYMDPGNWATDLEGGSRFGYQLIWVLLMSNLLAILLQTLSARLGIATGKDLAQACRDEYSHRVSILLWLLCEVAIVACDLAEVLGTALGLNLLFHIPLVIGVVITGMDTFLLLGLQRMGMRRLESVIIVLVIIIGGCFFIEIFLAKPDARSIVAGFVPILTRDNLFVAIGILGATVMPHNLYLHSSLVQTRRFEQSDAGKKEACKYNTIDSFIALNGAFLINAAIMIVAAAVFFSHGERVTEIQDAYKLLTPLLGTSAASIAFGVALLASGQSSTVTGTLAGQIVMEGFLRLHIRPVVRRLLTRSLAIVPAVVVISLFGDTASYQLLLVSQVILSMQLAFAVVPLIQFTSDKRLMGRFANGPILKAMAWSAAAIIVGLNGKLVLDALGTGISESSGLPHVVSLVFLPVAVLLGAFLAFIALRPFLPLSSGVLRKARRIRRRAERLSTESLLRVHASHSSSANALGFQRIGLALDRSEHDIPVVRRGIDLVRVAASSGEMKSPVMLLLIHSVESASSSIYGVDADDALAREGEEYLHALNTRITTELANNPKEASSGEVSIRFILGYGSPVTEIPRICKAEKLDLLIMGAHGHRGIKDLFFGTTVSPVRHALDIPVLVVK